MADIAPLTPLRYDLAKVALEKVVAPPYDVISPVEREELAARDPYNVVKLILPEGEGDAKYARARDLFFAWRTDGVLVRDQEPAFYRYDQTFTPPGGGKAVTRRGFLGLVKIVPLDQKIVMPHERTLSGPKLDRLKLFRATKTNFSPGFLLYSDPKRALDQALAHARELAAFDTTDGVRHAVAKITDREAIRTIVDGVRASSLLIADGHHRYETALAYMNETSGLGDRSEPRYFLEFFANGDDPDLLVFATHRHVHSLASFDWDALLKGAAEIFDVTPFPPGASADVYLAALKEKKEHALVACGGDGRAALLTLKNGADLSTHRVLGQAVPSLRRTDVGLLHMGILEPVLGITREMQAAKSNIWYPQDASAALRELKSGKGQVLFLMNGTPVRHVREVAEEGEVMPQKSTFFYPKVLTGLCIHTLEDDRTVAVG